MSEIALPEPAAWRWPIGEDLVYRESPPMHVPAALQTLFTAEQVRQAVLAERERAARVALETIVTTAGEFESVEFYGEKAAAAIRRG